MAETVTADQTDLHVDLPESPGHKRKRSSESASPDSRRIKRGAPTATMANPADTAAAAAAFMDNPLDASQLPDFSALQQATAEHSDASDPANASSTAAAALGSMYPTLHVPPTTEETFAAQALGEAEHHAHHHQDAFNGADVGHHTDGLPMTTAQPPQPDANGLRQEQRYVPPPQNAKPAVGSEEWHKMRKDNHKEVERRRRETINEGINELAKIVPGCEKNKGSILQRAVAFITQLKENETQNIEKWTLEKLLTEQAIAELSASNEKLKGEVERLYRELETWKRVAQNAGLQPPAEKQEPATSS
ncbi:uncharacterized protein E0L32_005493 [Thyridium curvatum]|uniref:BHLH domain-containing protein n=1 Tax=Thyridium curvatum TaxID=1093900 RepID=A0A507B3H0_9PEZI|nr:uncharacterized protein E0L32_005493 [Thyridium curvatum]TPX14297.1 hypothetical protein E0L32_005493 [Thyridium curvatum]